MTKIKNIKTVEFISIVVSFLGLVVLAGWYLEIEVLKSILPIWVSMKFSTALSFFISGLILYFSDRILKEESTYSRTILIILILLLWLNMVAFLLSTFSSFSTGIEEMFVSDVVAPIKTTFPGRPSVGTMLNFILVVFLGAFGVYDLIKSRFYIYVVSVLIMSVAMLAILGYIFSVPMLYYYVEGISSAMAVHTAILFFLLGIGFYIIGKSRGKKHKE